MNINPAFYTYRLNNIISVFPSWWMKREASMQSAESAAGLRYLSRWALLQARLLALICGPTMRGSSTHITCSRLETICLYVPSLMFSFPSRVAIAIHVVHCWVAVLLEWFIVHLIAFFKLQSLLLEMYRCRPITTCSKHTLKKCDSEVVYFGLLVSLSFWVVQPVQHWRNPISIKNHNAVKSTSLLLHYIIAYYYMILS